MGFQFFDLGGLHRNFFSELHVVGFDGFGYLDFYNVVKLSYFGQALLHLNFVLVFFLSSQEEFLACLVQGILQIFVYIAQILNFLAQFANFSGRDLLNRPRDAAH